MMPQAGLEEESVKASVRGFVLSNFLFGRDGDQLADEDSFIEKGILDSTGVLELSHFVEETYRLSIPDDELNPDNFDSIARLVRYIRSKRTS